MVNSDSDLMALLVLTVNWKFLFMFIVEITLCSFVRLNGSLKECYSLFDHQELLEGLVLSLDCFMLVKNTCSHTGISSTIKKKYCTNFLFALEMVLFLSASNN